MDNKYILAFVVAFILESALSAKWHYPTLKYVFGVPIVIILVWTFLLPLGYDSRNRFLKKPTLLNEIILISVSLLVLEIIGSALGWKLSVASQYPSIVAGCCNAPAWLYILYYFLIISYWRYLDYLGAR